MTREEAINELRELWHRWKTRSVSEGEAINMAIEALEQEPCVDAISRDELLKAIDTWDKYGYTETGCFVREPKGDYVPYIHYDDVIKCIKGMPSVKPKQRTGRWIEHPDIKTSVPEYLMFYECSECGNQQCFCKLDIHKKRFCSNCGAKMFEPEREDKE